jgi:hypothetical protein
LFEDDQPDGEEGYVEGDSLSENSDAENPSAEASDSSVNHVIASVASVQNDIDVNHVIATVASLLNGVDSAQNKIFDNENESPYDEPRDAKEDDYDEADADVVSVFQNSPSRLELSGLSEDQLRVIAARETLHLAQDFQQ